MKNNPLKKLESLGQSVWLDYIRRDMITDGELELLIREDGLRGMTSNPAIFEKAIAESTIYDHEIRRMALQQKDTKVIYKLLSQQDVRSAAAKFNLLYENTDKKDGYVSLEVNPHLAYNTKDTVGEGCQLWSALNRPNVLIKVPATSEGLPAIRQLISDGVNVNVTLLFGLPRYRQVTEAYIEGLEACLAQGKPINQITSVASFFLSRIDTALDPILEKIIQANSSLSEIAREAHGEVAISSAKEAYQIYTEVFGSQRFNVLAQKGARTQRLLWASTSNKNPAYSDVKYIEPLIGENTVSTVPPQTLDAYRDHGNPQLSIGQNIEKARRILTSLPKLGIDMDKVTQQLEEEGVAKFIDPYDKLMGALAKKSST